MMRVAVFFLAALAAAAAPAEESSFKVSVLDNAVLCLRASRVPDNVPDQIRAAAVPHNLAGTVLDLRFADDAATNAAEFFIHGKLPLVVLVNGETSGAAAQLATDLRNSGAAILIGSTNSTKALAPDVEVSVSPEAEKQFQADPFLPNIYHPFPGPSPTNLLAFVEHTSEAELVRKHVKDGEDNEEVSTPRAAPATPVVRDPALARAMDLLKALAALHPARG